MKKTLLIIILFTCNIFQSVFAQKNNADNTPDIYAHGVSIAELQFSTDGKYLFTTSQTDKKKLLARKKIWDLSTGQLITDAKNIPTYSVAEFPTYVGQHEPLKVEKNSLLLNGNVIMNDVKNKGFGGMPFAKTLYNENTGKGLLLDPDEKKQTVAIYRIMPDNSVNKLGENKIKFGTDLARLFSTYFRFYEYGAVSPNIKYWINLENGRIFDLENFEFTNKKEILTGKYDKENQHYIFSADNRYIAISTTENGNTTIIDLEKGKISNEIKNPYDDAKKDWSAYMSPDFKHIVYHYNKHKHKNETKLFAVYNIETGKTTSPTDTKSNNEMEIADYKKANEQELAILNKEYAEEKNKNISKEDTETPPTPKKTTRELNFETKLKSIVTKKKSFDRYAESLANDIARNKSKNCCLTRIENAKQTLQGFKKDYEGLLKEFDDILSEDAKKSLRGLIENIDSELNTLNNL